MKYALYELLLNCLKLLLNCLKYGYRFRIYILYSPAPTQLLFPLLLIFLNSISSNGRIITSTTQLRIFMQSLVGWKIQKNISLLSINSILGMARILLRDTPVDLLIN
eukprot:417617_1